MINKYLLKETNNQVLFYGTEEELDFPEYFNFELLEKDVKLTKENQELSIFSAKDTKDKVFGKCKRTRDIILAENRINRFVDLKAAYLLIRYRQLNATKSVRDMIIEKYSELLDYLSEKDNNENTN